MEIIPHHYRTFGHCLLVAGALILNLVSAGQDQDYYKEHFIRNENANYKDNIRSIQLYRAGFELSPPVIQFRSDEKLFLTFDDLEEGVKQYRYTVIHCDAYWNTSQILQMEYIEGFMEDYINDYKYSFNTTIPFTNYVLVFPTDNLRLKKSGNYILKVYDETDREENVIFTRRFMVVDPRISIDAKVNKTTSLDERYTHQQVDFKIYLNGYTITEPYRDLFVTILQNGRWDNAIRDLQPRMIIDNILDYTQIRENTFMGGNEFRYFDMKTLKYNTDRMLAIQYDHEGYQVYLQPDLPRSRNYRSEEDINGRRLIAVNNSYDPLTEADYAWVHFYLPFPAPLADGNLYVTGALTDWQFNTTALMHYNLEQKAYEAKLLLKQGYYNYAYSFLPNGSDKADISLIEGTFWETENEYSILVYHRRQGDYYDQLIGAFHLNSYQ